MVQGIQSINERPMVCYEVSHGRMLDVQIFEKNPDKSEAKEVKNEHWGSKS